MAFTEREKTLTKKKLSFVAWWEMLNAELASEGETDALLWEAREQYEIGNEPKYSALSIKADRAYKAQARARNWDTEDAA
jgi:hypothetical protein